MSRPDIAALADDCVELADELALNPDFDDDDVPTLVASLVRLAEARDAVQVLYKLTETACIHALDAAGVKVFEAEGVKAERHRARRGEKADAKLLLGHVAARALSERVLDPDTGEAEPREDAVVRGLCDAYGLDRPSVSFRKTWLVDHGLHVDDYVTCDWVDALQLTRPKGGDK